MWKRAVPGWLADAYVRGAAATAEIPSPRALPIIGTTTDLIAAGGAPKLHEYVDARHRQLGPIYREYIGPVRSVLVADPNDMRRVFSLEGKYPKHLLPAPWVVYNKMYGCKRGLFFM
jgi:ecdysteroid 2-hydroxylase